MNRFWSTLLAGAAGGLITFGASQWLGSHNHPAPQSFTEPSYTAPARQVNYGGTPAPFDFVKAAEKSMPAVVHIKASESREASIRRQQQEYRSNPFRQFFGDDLFGDYSQPRSGTGSGVIFSSDGYIVTNNHVVEFADEFDVTLNDNREFKARLVGKDPNTDIAVIKIEATGLPAIELGNSDDVRVGEWALAVGNPFDLASTVTAGIISAKGRDINIIRKGAAIESFLQTDAAVNPGNSGGALVDINGRLVGINSAIATPTGVFAGYAFAVPVNLAKRIADDLIKYGEYRRPYLGVEIANLDKVSAEQLEIPYSPGVVIVDVDPQGSAGQAGIKGKDVVVKVNGRNINTTSELRELIGRSQVGETVQLTIRRDGKDRDIPVKLRPLKNN